jgi:hypothetical protein
MKSWTKVYEPRVFEPRVSGSKVFETKDSEENVERKCMIQIDDLDIIE